MKTSHFLPGLLLACCVALQAHAQSERESSLLEVFRQNTTNWRLAYNSKDASQLAPLYAKDAVYISSHVQGLEAKGREAVIANFQRGMTAGGFIDSIEILQMNTACNMATLLCRYQATNNGVTVVGRNLLVLQQVEGVWLIVVHMTVV